VLIIAPPPLLANLITLLPASLDPYPIVSSIAVAESLCSSTAGPVDLKKVSFLKHRKRNFTLGKSLYRKHSLLGGVTNGD